MVGPCRYLVRDTFFTSSAYIFSVLEMFIWGFCWGFTSGSCFIKRGFFGAGFILALYFFGHIILSFSFFSFILEDYLLLFLPFSFIYCLLSLCFFIYQSCLSISSILDTPFTRSLGLATIFPLFCPFSVLLLAGCYIVLLFYRYCLYGLV
ncbi:hypothetical protein BJ508DRAFT_43212 [Ascobolus immersus RN42]|uniref:Uncharacterized protein n=1 Tax=Ascobolus immersus RN42 TaxID=1160509 RepID=A0A3N4IRM9_ASCIM|nr:hypothetical protein BJ508DRAFT_43212 [Ascobolus immersus RN42]